MALLVPVIGDGMRKRKLLGVLAIAVAVTSPVSGPLAGAEVAVRGERHG